jgi:hypothetical protein
MGRSAHKGVVFSNALRPRDPHGVVHRPVATLLLAWLSMIGADLLLHAGVLAPLYDWDSPFLLSPVDAFIRIPAGYLGFLVLAAGMLWLLPRLGVQRGRDGAVMAAMGGAVAWGGLLLGLWSISTAEPALLVGWWIGQAAELALAGWVVGSILGGATASSMGWKLGAILIVGLASAVALQSVGYANAPVLIDP